MVHIDPIATFSPFGASTLKITNLGHLTANILKTVSRSVTCQYIQLELNISSTDLSQKMCSIARGAAL